MSKRRRYFRHLEKEGYTILAPDMCPIHFDLIGKVLELDGLHLKFVTPTGREAKDEGLRSVQNDACYPAIITTGAFVAELEKGTYDLNKTAVIMTQTGGGCRASNYISLIKKAFNKLYPTVPVLSMNFSGLEKDHSLPISLKRCIQLYDCVMYGDMLMNLINQSLPYYPKEDVEKAKQDCLDMLYAEIGHRSFKNKKENYAKIIDRFSSLQPPKEGRKPKVAIVGEIFVKYSPYANNHLSDFLVSQGCEAVLPSLNEFLLYCLYNFIQDHDYYGFHRLSIPFWRFLYRYALKLGRDASKALEGTTFTPYDDFDDIRKAGKEVVDLGVKMGEGWVIPAEMVNFARGDVKNIVVVQPFGCLPNHIVGKGMIRPVKKLCPDANIVPLDFDASSTQVNQENRLKLMLANLKK